MEKTYIRVEDFLIEFSHMSQVCLYFRAYEILTGDNKHSFMFARPDVDDIWDNPITGMPNEECNVFCRGEVWSSGKMNFDFPTTKHTMIQTYGRPKEIGALLEAVYDHAAKLFGDHWYGDK